jgi:hypothetical protein
MIDFTTFKKIALSFHETNEEPHFEKPSFRIKGKIFATLDIKKNQACVKLSLIDQDLFSLADKTIIFPVPNKWGKQGWTFINLEKIGLELLIEVLKTAYSEVLKGKSGLKKYV